MKVLYLLALVKRQYFLVSIIFVLWPFHDIYSREFDSVGFNFVKRGANVVARLVELPLLCCLEATLM